MQTNSIRSCIHDLTMLVLVDIAPTEVELFNAHFAALDLEDVGSQKLGLGRPFEFGSTDVAALVFPQVIRVFREIAVAARSKLIDRFGQALLDTLLSSGTAPTAALSVESLASIQREFRKELASSKLPKSHVDKVVAALVKVIVAKPTEFAKLVIRT